MILKTKIKLLRVIMFVLGVVLFMGTTSCSIFKKNNKPTNNKPDHYQTKYGVVINTYIE